MAALAIPIATAIIQFLPHIPDLVKTVEGLLGPGTGAAKKTLAINMGNQAAAALAVAGKISGIPTLEEVAAGVQTSVDLLNATGQLGKPATVPIPAPAAAATTGAVGAPRSTLGPGSYTISGTFTMEVK